MMIEVEQGQRWQKQWGTTADRMDFVEILRRETPEDAGDDYDGPESLGWWAKNLEDADEFVLPPEFQTHGWMLYYTPPSVSTSLRDMAVIDHDAQARRTQPFFQDVRWGHPDQWVGKDGRDRIHRLQRRISQLESEVAVELTEGVIRIAAERRRHIDVHHWSFNHDDMHTDGSLLSAAKCYLTVQQWVLRRSPTPGEAPPDWPWEAAAYKPSTSHMRNLEKAGALIAAEIDRLLRRRNVAAGASAEVKGMEPTEEIHDEAVKRCPKCGSPTPAGHPIGDGLIFSYLRAGEKGEIERACTDPFHYSTPEGETELLEAIRALRPEKCPRCHSPEPKLHPAVQFEGEVSPCPHPWHEVPRD